jgi:hypothetical protein
MRKTVYEWLDANRNGTGMSKKRALRKKSNVPRSEQLAATRVDPLVQKPGIEKKQAVKRKTARKRKPR